MRIFNDYDYIFCDIDDTLIYGFWTDIMRYTWGVLRNNTVSDFLMSNQNRFNIFKVNERLRFILNRYKGKLYFLTARKEHPATYHLLSKIISRDFEVIALATDNPIKDKIEEIKKLTCAKDKVCVFDDNKGIRWNAIREGYDAFDPVVMIEGLKI